MCQSSRRPRQISSASASVAAPAPQSATIMARRRSQRSTRAPAKGSSSMPGSVVTSVMRAKSVAELVCW